MRTQIVFAVLWMGWFAQICWAGHTVDFQLDFAESATSAANDFDPASGHGPFINRWELKGIEDIDPYPYCTGYRLPKKSELPPIVREQFFAGTWTRPYSVMERSLPLDNVCRVSYRFSPIPSTLPPFNPRVLVEDLWPLTRSYLESNEDADAYAE